MSKQTRMAAVVIQYSIRKPMTKITWNRMHPEGILPRKNSNHTPVIANIKAAGICHAITCNMASCSVYGTMMTVTSTEDCVKGK